MPPCGGRLAVPVRMGNYSRNVLDMYLGFLHNGRNGGLKENRLPSDRIPARIVVPDPRVFIVHKLWLNRQEDRQPVKKPRDRQQAMAVTKLIRQYLPQYEFTSSEVKMFPKDVVEVVCLYHLGIIMLRSGTTSIDNW